MKRIFQIYILIFYAIALQLDATVVDVLGRMEERAKQSKSDALLVVRNGKTVFDYHCGKDFPRLECQEMTRPIMALAIGFLCDERYIRSLDTPVSSFCPAWNEGPDASITIRTLLAQGNSAFYRLEELVQALSGSEWRDYLQLKLFTPLGIKQGFFVDRQGYPKLCLTAVELAKIGLLIVRNGELHGKQLLSRSWIERLQEPIGSQDPFLGIQWFLEYYDFATYWDEALLDQYDRQGISCEAVDRLKNINGRVIHLGGLAIRGHLVHAWGQDIFSCLGGQNGLSSLLQETYCAHLPFGRFDRGGIKSLVAWGRGGQQLIIVPSRHLVAVRQSSSLNCSDTFEDLIEVLDDYIKEVDCYVD